MCLQTKKIVKNREVVFMEYGTSFGNTLEIRPKGRNEGPTTVNVDESSKSSSCNDGEVHDQQVRDHLIVHKEAIKIPMENNGHVKRFGKDGRYPKGERRLLGEW